MLDFSKLPKDLPPLLLPWAPAKEPPRLEPPEDSRGFNLQTVLDMVSRPGSAVSGAVRALQEDRDPLDAAFQNLKGERRDSFVDVAANAGLEGPTKWAAGIAGDVVLDPLNLVGGAIGKGVIKGAGLAGKAVKALPGVEAAAGAVKASKVGEIASDVARMVVPHWDIRKAKDYLASRRLLNAKLGAAQDRARRSAVDLFKGTTPAEQEAVAFALDTGQTLGDPRLAEKATAAKAAFDEMWQAEVAAGLQDPSNFRTNYVSYVVEGPDGPKVQQKLKALNAKLGAANERTLDSLQTVKELGGSVNAAQILATRGANSARARLTAEFFKDTAERFGVKVAEGAGVPEGFRIPQLAADSKLTRALKDVALPETIAADLEKVIQKSEASGPLWDAYKKVTHLGKAYATRLNPGFTLTNEVGNLFNMSLSGDLNPLTALVQQAKALMWERAPSAVKVSRDGLERLAKAGKPVVSEYAGPELLEKAHQLGVIGERAGTFRELEDLTGQALSRAQMTPARKVLHDVASPTDNLAMRAGTALNNRVEDSARLALWLRLIETGHTPEEAALGVSKFLFDYSELTPEMKKLRDFGIPFLTWSLKNIPLQAEMLVKNPKHAAWVANLEKGSEAGAASEGVKVAEGERPGWMSAQGAFQLPLTTDKGNRMFLSPKFPIQDLNRLPNVGKGAGAVGEFLKDSVLSNLNPLLKAPLEFAMNKQAFSEQPIYDERKGPWGLVKAPAWAVGLWRKAPELAGQLGITTLVKGGYRQVVMPAALSFVAQQLPLASAVGRLVEAPSGAEAQDTGTIGGVSPEALSALGVGTRTYSPHDLKRQAVAQRRAALASRKAKLLDWRALERADTGDPIEAVKKFVTS